MTSARVHLRIAALPVIALTSLAASQTIRPTTHPAPFGVGLIEMQGNGGGALLETSRHAVAVLAAACETGDVKREVFETLYAAATKAYGRASKDARITGNADGQLMLQMQGLALQYFGQADQVWRLELKLRDIISDIGDDPQKAEMKRLFTEMAENHVRLRQYLLGDGYQFGKEPDESKELKDWKRAQRRMKEAGRE